MKRIVALILSLSLMSSMFAFPFSLPFGKNEKDDGPKTRYEEDAEKSEKQQQNKDYSKEIAIGTGVAGLILLGPLGAIGGAAAGYILGKNDISEYINVETRFVFAKQDTNENPQTMIYGSKEVNSGDYFLPIFTVGEDVYLNVEMSPSLLSKAKKASKKQKSTELLIPVEIVITKSKNIEVSRIAGMSNISVENYADGTAKYSFFMKNDPSLHPSMRFMFTPAETGLAEIHVTYGTDAYKVVDSTCDVFQTVKFTK